MGTQTVIITVALLNTDILEIVFISWLFCFEALISLDEFDLLEYLLILFLVERIWIIFCRVVTCLEVWRSFQFINRVYAGAPILWANNSWRLSFLFDMFDILKTPRSHCLFSHAFSNRHRRLCFTLRGAAFLTFRFARGFGFARIDNLDVWGIFVWFWYQYIHIWHTYLIW